MRKISIIISSLLLLCNCTAKHRDLPDNLVVVPLHDITYNKSLKLSSFAESVEAIPLETTEESLIGEVRQLFYQDGKYFLRATTWHARSRVMVFSETGKFLLKIDRIGQGKGEYVEMDDFVITPQSQIKALVFLKTVTYDLQGNDLYEARNEYCVDEGVGLKDGTYLISRRSSEDKLLALYNRVYVN